jgi:hypothetical protein
LVNDIFFELLNIVKRFVSQFYNPWVRVTLYFVISSKITANGVLLWTVQYVYISPYCFSGILLACTGTSLICKPWNSHLWLRISWWVQWRFNSNYMYTDVTFKDIYIYIYKLHYVSTSTHCLKRHTFYHTYQSSSTHTILCSLPCQSSFHQFLHSHHHLSSGAGTIGRSTQNPTAQIKKIKLLKSMNLLHLIKLYFIERQSTIDTEIYHRKQLCFFLVMYAITEKCLPLKLQISVVMVGRWLVLESTRGLQFEHYLSASVGQAQTYCDQKCISPLPTGLS